MYGGVKSIFAKNPLKGFWIILLVSLLNASPVFPNGYRIPEQSADAVALSGATVANAHGPSSSYNNPANMVWEADRSAAEASLSVIQLDRVNFRGTFLGVAANADSESETAYLPNLHYISPKVGNARFGLSLVYPFGLSKRWTTLPQKTFFQEFTLETIELDGSIGYLLTEQISVGGGIRGIRSEGTVKGNGSAALPNLGTRNYSRDLKGDDFSYGYYLAFTVKPVKSVVMAVTYRSRVTAELEGNAKISASGPGGGSYDGPGAVDVVLPATLQVASALTHKKMVLEVVFERTYWSKYKTLDFEYGRPLNSPILSGVFDAPIPKNWQDADTYRLGFTYQQSNAFSWMLGFAIDETPVPENTVNFEIPDADALVYSAGIAYRPGEHTQMALAYLISKKKGRSVTNNSKGINGRFESGGQLVNLSLVHAF